MITKKNHAFPITKWSAANNLLKTGQPCNCSFVLPAFYLELETSKCVEKGGKCVKKRKTCPGGAKISGFTCSESRKCCIPTTETGFNVGELSTVLYTT